VEIPKVELTTIDPATGATTAIGETGFSAVQGPSLAIDRATGTLWGVLRDGRLFTVDAASGRATPVEGVMVTTERDRAQPLNLAIRPASCSQPETTTTTAPPPVETTTTTDPPATTTTAPPARAATPVPAQPNFTG
jgi:hypothetical protein